ncbi:Dynactin subunit 1, partial [Spheniscus magellanicus]
KDSPLLLQQIDALQLSIKHLKNENNRLKGDQMKMELASLTPLQVPKISLPKNKQGEGLATHMLYRKTSQLLETLYQMSANAKVVDMKQTKSARSSSARLLEQTARLWSLKNSIDTLRVRQAPSPPPAPARAAGTFPAAAGARCRRGRVGGMAYYGKVTFPCQPGHSQAHRLLLTPELLHELRHHFVS